jgi:hypothetical protein
VSWRQATWYGDEHLRDGNTQLALEFYKLAHGWDRVRSLDRFRSLGEYLLSNGEFRLAGEAYWYAEEWGMVRMVIARAHAAGENEAGLVEALEWRLQRRDRELGASDSG